MKMIRSGQTKTNLLLAGLGAAVILAGCGCSRQTGKPQESGSVDTSVAESSETGMEESQSAANPTISSFPDGENGPGESVGEKETMPEETGNKKYEWVNQIIIGTDTHYLARSLTDGGTRFQQTVEHGDGKVETYIEPITDAFLDDVISQEPDVLILSGDLTLDGEKASHEELADKLYAVERSGIPVLVIPGNHDINNRQAARFEGENRLPAESTTPGEFVDIYKDFGYDEAIRRDPYSLSYVYELDEQSWFLMLDSCQYRPLAKVGGAISSETYEWIEAVLEEAWDNNVRVIPVAHHNLLDESEIYVDDCTIEHGEQLAEILDSWDVSLFLSGHLHVQHWKRSEENRGVMEIVTSSLATPACEYGVLNYFSDNSFSYKTQSVDVEGWAAKRGRREADLLNFNKFKEPFLKKVFYNQSYDALQDVEELSEKQKVRMSNLYAELNYYYYQGTAYQIKDSILKNPDYSLWLDEGGGTELSEYVQYILRDAKRDYNRAEKQ